MSLFLNSAVMNSTSVSSSNSQTKANSRASSLKKNMLQQKFTASWVKNRARETD